MAVTVALIVSVPSTTTLETVGAGPEPFSKVTSAPDAKPEPVMVILIVLPASIEFGVIPSTTTPMLTVAEVMKAELSEAFEERTLNVPVSVSPSCAVSGIV